MKHLPKWLRLSPRAVALVLVVYWAVLCIGTHLPGRLARGLDRTSLVSDKTLHFFAYAGLGILLAAALPLLGVRTSRRYWIAFLIAVTYGALDELGQIPIPGRTADGVDWLADAAGAVAGVVGYRLAEAVLTSRSFRLRGQKKPSPP